ncbi:outer membrane beta-barrel protein [Vibrio crassostreae]|jgi:opacity protein-like surface antigen|uniref:outer membrane beta-barrel protein n=1 Tax=Vibrio crassostreae TaxID=246167 RepID=UPI001B30FCBE|nr:outer membrane beta-barrel protein [Vibrio crassostreae]
MKRRMLFLMASSIPGGVLAQGKEDVTDHYWSIGKSKVTAEASGYDDVDMDGFGVNLVVFSKYSKVGYGASFDYAHEDNSTPFDHDEESAWSFSFILGLRPVDWLVIKPMIGITIFEAELNYNYSENGLMYGIGTTAEIPSTNIFLDASYKVHHVGGLVEDLETSSTFIGIGYKF